MFESILRIISIVVTAISTVVRIIDIVLRRRNRK